MSTIKPYLYTCIHTSGGQMHRGVNVLCNPLKPCFYIWQVNIFMQLGKIGDTQKQTNKQTQHIFKLVIVQNKWDPKRDATKKGNCSKLGAINWKVGLLWSIFSLLYFLQQSVRGGWRGQPLIPHLRFLAFAILCLCHTILLTLLYNPILHTICYTLPCHTILHTSLKHTLP